MTDNKTNQEHRTGLEIAVIGMSGRFPGASTIERFWNLLRDGIEGITFFTEEQLNEAGVADHVRKDPNFVNGLAIVEDCDRFDARFFGYTPKEAELMDPQVRLFHECVWEALEQGGYDPFSYEGIIGLYAGASGNLFWETLVMQSPERQVLGDFAAAQLSDKDYLCTRISFKFNLRGPSYTIQTACSTSLVAIHVACQALLNGECDMALAGGSKISAFGNTGYMYQEGMIFSPDGHCRPFDADSKGTVGGNGVAVVLLKPLEEALEDRDYIYAVVKGTAVNNDGSHKAGYAAPAPEGQCAAIKVACQVAEVEPESISFIETHGTGTDLGDPIEVEALIRAFDSQKRGICGIGSVKSNIGHLDSAAGVAGFIKAALALHHRFLPPTLHYKAPNPRIDFENSPFYVVDKPTPWTVPNGPLRAGVSSFGIGGTNAHVILEEAPAGDYSLSSASSHRTVFLLPLSARTGKALDEAVDNLHFFLDNNPSLAIADTAYTLQVGRRHFEHRQAVVCNDTDEACRMLGAAASAGRIRYNAGDTERPLVFLFPGAGTQYQDMGLGLYRTEPIFRRHLDHCFELLKSFLGYDLKELLYPGECNGASTVDPSFFIDDTGVAQPLLFAFEYALAQLLMTWGVGPYAMIGHSLGEYVAACISGVVSLEDGLRMVALRARLMQAMPEGAMLGVPLTEERIRSILPVDLDLALVNAPESCVVSGSKEAIDRFARILVAGGVEPRRLHSSHAAHSRMMEPMLADYRNGLEKIHFMKPRIPYISNLTGNWITVAEATSPDYWLNHLRRPVRFSDGLKPLLEIPDAIFVEVGPGRILTSFARQHPEMAKDRLATDLVRHPKKEAADDRFFLERIAALWTWGVKLDWRKFTGEQDFCRIPLPTYPFQRQTYKLDDRALKEGRVNSSAVMPGIGKPDPADWFYLPSWKRSKNPVLEEGNLECTGSWVVFEDEVGIGERIAHRLEELNLPVARIKPGDRYYIEETGLPGGIVFCRSIGSEADDTVEVAIERNFHNLIDLVRDLGNTGRQERIAIFIITANGMEVTGGDLAHPFQALIAGALRVVPLEYPHIACRAIDIEETGDPVKQARQAELLLAELSANSNEPLTAYRAGRRWIHTFQPERFEACAEKIPGRLQKNGVYLLPGGMGGVGLELARYLAETLQATLILTHRGRGDDDLSLRERELIEELDIKSIADYPGLPGNARRYCAQLIDSSLAGAGISLASPQVIPKRKRLLASLVRHRDELITEANVNAERANPLSEEWLSAEYPMFKGMFRLLKHCSSKLPDVLTGKADGLSALYPGGDSTLMADAGADIAGHSYTRLHGEMLGELLRQAAQTMADGRKLRILEVGGGHGQLAGMLLPHLEKTSTHYYFTDLGTTFVQEAKNRAAQEGRDFMEFSVLDISKNPANQGFDPSRFDVVVGLNVVHATPDVLETLGHLKSLLVPGGLLALIEDTNPQPWDDMIWGLTDGWWYFTDTDLRPQSPLMGVETWKTALRDAGFQKVESRPGEGIDRQTADSALLLARTETACCAVQDSRVTIREDKLTSIRRHAKDVMVRQLDIADPEQVGQLVDLAVETYGRIDGIIHLAGVPDGAVIHRRTRRMSDDVLAPKVNGILAFDRVLSERGLEPDFVVYFSSLASHLPGFGQAAHCSANAFLDAFALYKQHRSDTFHLAIDWNSWREVGQAAEAAKKAAARVDVALENGVSVKEGIDIFCRALSENEPHIAISSIPIDEMESRLRNAADEESGIMQTLREDAVEPAGYDRPELSIDYVEAQTPTQKTLAEIWRHYFGFEKIGINDDFFELGGDSLRAINFLSRLHKEFQVKIPLAAFFNHPTISELAVYIEGSIEEAYDSITPVDARENYPLSSAQRRLYFLQRFDPSATGYNETQLVWMEGPLDTERLQAAFRGLIKRHESLRTSMTMNGDEPVQRIHDADAVHFELELRDGSVESIEAEMEDFVRPFDLEIPVYVRARLLKIADLRHILMIDMHHLVTDDVSDKVFVEEFLQLYKGVALQPLTLHYRDFACWQKRRRNSGVINKQRDYWRNVLSGELPSLQFPIDFPRPQTRDYRGASIPFVIEKNTAAALKRMASEAGATLFMALLAAYNVLLEKYTGAGDILVGTPVAGRPQVELDRIIGMFVNTLVIRSFPDGDKSFIRFLEEVRESTLAAFQNQDVQFEEIVADLGLERNQSGNLLFDTMINMLDRNTDSLTVGDLRLKPYELPWVSAKYDFKLEAYELAGTVHLRLNYCRSLFKPETMERMAASMHHILEAVAQDPSISISAIELSPGMPRHMLDDFNDDLENME